MQQIQELKMAVRNMTNISTRNLGKLYTMNALYKVDPESEKILCDLMQQATYIQVNIFRRRTKINRLILLHFHMLIPASYLLTKEISLVFLQYLSADLKL